MKGTKGTGFVRCCLEGLERMYLPSEGLFAYSTRWKDGSLVRERDPEKEVKFTLNALLGLQKARAAGHEVFLDVEGVYGRLLEWACGARRPGAALSPSRFLSDPENTAALVWTGLSLGAALPESVRREWERALDRGVRSGRLTAQALAWGIVAGTSAGDAGRESARRLASHALRAYVHPRTSLVRHQPVGPRRAWASFAASCYMSWALLTLARLDDERPAGETGLRIARALVRLQGPQGQWAWLYHVPSGTVLDSYPVYSVHQHAMAPFFLLEAIDQGHGDLRGPLELGFRWVLGQNELGSSMVDPHLRLIWRSVTRSAGQGRLARFAGALRASVTRRRSAAARVEVNRECRSYELAWGLYAFAGRRDFPDIMDHHAFGTGRDAA